MRSRRPEIFVSATSADLRSCRQVVKEGLLTLGCVPVEQTNFPPDYRRVHDVLRARIAGCDAVIHLVGKCYGAEPAGRDAAAPRRSYTQLEYDLARELRKPLYVFLCDPAFAYDAHAAEELEKQRLQQAHRAALAAGDTLRCEVGSRTDLALRIRELQTSVEQLTVELRKTRSWLGRGVAVGVVALLVLSGGLWWLNQRTARNESRVASLESQFDRQRRYAAAVIEVYREQQAEFERLRLSDAERLERVLGAVAAREKKPEAAIWSEVSAFLTAVRANPRADQADRALAEEANRSIVKTRTSSAPAVTASRELQRALEVPPTSPPPERSRRPVAAGHTGSELEEVRARMTGRQYVIDALRMRQVVGENNRGFLEARAQLQSAEEKAVSEENSDRAKVYGALAAQTGSSVESVGRARATQIAARASRGVWIQDSAGGWRQKP